MPHANASTACLSAAPLLPILPLFLSTCSTVPPGSTCSWSIIWFSRLSISCALCLSSYLPACHSLPPHMRARAARALPRATPPARTAPLLRAHFRACHAAAPPRNAARRAAPAALRNARTLPFAAHSHTTRHCRMHCNALRALLPRARAGRTLRRLSRYRAFFAAAFGIFRITLLPAATLTPHMLPAAHTARAHALRAHR